MSESIKINYEPAQRAELHRRIWAIADDVRGAVDGWDLEFDQAKFSDEEEKQDFKPNTVEDRIRTI